jgi:cytoskeletal protein CcmA (bactofilin family)
MSATAQLHVLKKPPEPSIIGSQDNEVFMSAPSTASFQSPVANATIGPNVVIKGEIISREDLTIQGEVEGTVEMGENTLTIALDGKVCADVNAREMEVRGSVDGTIRASEKVYVRNRSIPPLMYEPSSTMMLAA